MNLALIALLAFFALGGGDLLVLACKYAYSKIKDLKPPAGLKLDGEISIWRATFLGLALVLAIQGVEVSGCRLPEIPYFVTTQKATAVTYVYEKDETTIPSGVLVALSKLNAGGILATTFEDDSTDGTGEIPDQYKIPLAAAKEAGLPSLVVTAGEKVLRTVKAPTSESQVMEAVK